MYIHENHKRSIETTFRMLDELICTFERWANGNEIHSLLYQEHNTLTDKQRQQLRDEIATLQNLLKEVKDDLQLKGFAQDLGMALQGSAVLFTDYLEELKGRRLKASGEPSKELVAYLDPKLDKFIEHLYRISHIGREAIEKSKGE